MTTRVVFTGRFQRPFCILLTLMIAAAPSAPLMAQTNAAQQAVRRQVDRYGQQETPAYPTPAGSSAESKDRYSDPSVPKIDTNFILPTASAVLVLRPAQILTAPNSEMLPKEVAAAAGLKYLGFDPAEIEEVIAFVDLSNPLDPKYGVTIKFTNPFRASVIPLERRAHAQLAELGGKKYLQSAIPILYSLYGPNNKTLVLAPDATLRQLVDSIGQPKTGPLLDRVLSAPAGSDLYLAVDAASLRPHIEMGLAQAQAHVPPDAKPMLEAIKTIAAAEFTLNLSNDGPISAILHATDEAAAQQLETLITEANAKTMAAAGDDPIQQAISQYTQRVWQPFQPRRDGASVTCVNVDNQSPAQKQFIVSVINGLCAVGLPAAMQAANSPPGEAPAAFEFDSETPPQEPADPTLNQDPSATPTFTDEGS